jgi:hypothetical protein
MHPSPSLLPVFERWAGIPDFAASDRGGALIDVLGATPDERAARLLVRLATELPAAAPRCAVSLSLSLFRFGSGFDDETRAAALEVVRRAESPVDRMVLRSIAGDPSVTADIEVALRGNDAELRWAAAFALATTDTPCPRQALIDAAEVATDVELFRRLAEASIRCGVPMQAAALRPFLHDPAASPEAMAWAAVSLEAGAGSGGHPSAAARRAREGLGRLLRSSLRHGDARVRAGAARALAELGDREAYRALLRTLEDRDANVRRAAARALEVLAVPDAADEIEAVARTVGDPFLHAAVMDAARAAWSAGDGGRAREPLRFVRRGVEVYRAAPLDVPGDARVDVDLVLPDGTYRRFAARPGGRLLVVGLPYGPVQARVEVRAPTGEDVGGPLGEQLKACSAPPDHGTISAAKSEPCGILGD